MPLVVEALQKRFGGKTVLDGVTHVFPERGAAMIAGASGCGKTTLLRILLGLETPDAGRVHVPQGARVRAVFQEDRLVAHMTAQANIALACPESEPEQIRAMLSQLDLDPLSTKPVRAYSGGMQRRVAIVRALMSKPDILLLDEPFTGLDEQIREKAAALIRREMAQGLVVVVTHDKAEAELLGCGDVLALGAKQRQDV